MTDSLRVTPEIADAIRMIPEDRRADVVLTIDGDRGRGVTLQAVLDAYDAAPDKPVSVHRLPSIDVEAMARSARSAEAALRDFGDAARRVSAALSDVTLPRGASDATPPVVTLPKQHGAFSGLPRRSTGRGWGTKAEQPRRDPNRKQRRKAAKAARRRNRKR